jgi:hypothetical protein
LAVVGRERLIFSLDLKLGQPLGNSAGWRGLDAWGIARTALEIGVRRMIVLDLARVGMDGGVGTENLCRRCDMNLGDTDAGIEIIGGSGVRVRRICNRWPPQAAAAGPRPCDGRLSVEDAQIRARWHGLNDSRYSTKSSFVLSLVDGQVAVVHLERHAGHRRAMQPAALSVMWPRSSKYQLPVSCPFSTGS